MTKDLAAFVKTDRPWSLVDLKGAGSHGPSSRTASCIFFIAILLAASSCGDNSIATSNGVTPRPTEGTNESAGPQNSEKSGYRRPRARFLPAAAPVGVKVRVRGNGFKTLRGTRGRIDSSYGIALQRIFRKPFGCEFNASGKHNVTIDSSGRLRGWFVVPEQGSCTQTDLTREVTPARYYVVIGCGTCNVGRFTVKVH